MASIFERLRVRGWPEKNAAEFEHFQFPYGSHSFNIFEIVQPPDPGLYGPIVVKVLTSATPSTLKTSRNILKSHALDAVTGVARNPMTFVSAVTSKREVVDESTTFVEPALSKNTILSPKKRLIGKCLTLGITLTNV